MKTSAKRLMEIVLLLFVVVTASACVAQPSSTVLKAPVTNERYDMSVVTTVGNRSYIPINIDGNPADHVMTILGALAAFEAVHPALEITDWKIEKKQSAYFTSSYIYGIWVDHRPKR